jgi:hypothetical protein
MNGKNSAKNTIMTVIFVLLLGAAVFGGYFYFKTVSDRRAKEKAEKQKEPTEIENIIAINLRINYPETARSAVKFYCRIIQAIHNLGPTDDELSKLQFQLRELFDNELLLKNSVTDQYNALKLEIMEYDDLSRTIEDYLVDAAGNSETWTYEEHNYTRIIVNFTIKEKGSYGTLYEEFILRADEDGRWKILGWRRVDKDGLPMK